MLSALPSPTIDLVIPTAVPPTYRLPPIPAPPTTWSAPVAVLVEFVMFFIDVIPPTNNCWFMETSPPSLICIILVVSSKNSAIAAVPNCRTVNPGPVPELEISTRSDIRTVSLTVVLIMLPVTLNEPSTVNPPYILVLPPINTLPPIPTPPVTWSAPVPVLVEFVVFVIDDVGAVTVPVKVGDAKFAFRSSAVCWAVETGFAVSAVLSTFESPTMV